MLGCGRISAKFNFLQAECTTRTFQRSLKPKSSVEIPPRIKRGPLDILQALSDSVQPKYPSRNILIPDGESFMKTNHKLVMLSLESGKKAAKWIVKENPELFQHKVSDPFIKAFAPKPTYKEESEISEETLCEAIQDINVSGAIQVYNLLKEKNIDVSQSTKEKLLELVCFFNSEDERDPTLVIGKYLEDAVHSVLNKWKKDSFADRLFNEMDPSSHSYSVMIMGLLKYNNVQLGRKLFKEAIAKNIQLSVGVYNSLLECIDVYTFQHQQRLDEIKNILELMAENKIRPNCGTFNSVMKSSSKMRHASNVFLANAFFQGFRSLNIEPSLATYHYFLLLRGSHIRKDEFCNLIDEVGKKNWKLSHVDDPKFFPTAIRISRKFRDLALCEMVHEIFLSCERRICTTFVIRAQYYRNYFLCHLEIGDIKDALDIFNALKPSNFLSDYTTTVHLIQHLRENNCVEQLPRVWDNIKELKLVHGSNVMGVLLETTVAIYNETIKDTALDIIENTLDAAQLSKNLQFWNENILENCLLLSLLIKDLTVVMNTFDKVEKMSKEKHRELSEHACIKFIEFSIDVENKKGAMKGVKYLVTHHCLPSSEIISRLKTVFHLKNSEMMSLGVN